MSAGTAGDPIEPLRGVSGRIASVLVDHESLSRAGRVRGLIEAGRYRMAPEGHRTIVDRNLVRDPFPGLAGQQLSSGRRS